MKYLLSIITIVMLLQWQNAAALGGCGSNRLPVDAGSFTRTQVGDKKLILSLISEYGNYDNFVAQDDPITNPGGNEAIIQETTAMVDYGVNQNVKVTLLVPYIKKEQQTNRFNKRVAKGIGDVAAFGRFCLLSRRSKSDPEVYLGAGIKFPTGSTDEPGGATAELPPAFQVGSGAYDFIPTLSYEQQISRFVLFGATHYRIPLEENDKGYEFGREFRLNMGASYPLDNERRHSISANLEYLNAEQDKDSGLILPARLRDGETVVNTGGNFVNLSVGFNSTITQRWAMQFRLSLPIQEDWNGDPSLNVGQVAPDYTIQLGVVHAL